MPVSRIVLRAPLCAVLSAALSLGGCVGGGDPNGGLMPSPQNDGPQIIWDLDHKPFPRIPFPNDSGTRSDIDSPTGRRVNASTEAPTRFERSLRERLLKEDGYGTFMPMWVEFDRRLDLVDIATRQTGDTNYADDAVFLVNVTPGSPNFGKVETLDFGNGSFPVTVKDPADYFQNDPRVRASNLAFEVYDERGIYDVLDQNGNPIPSLGDGDDHCDVWEDSNQNGVLDPGEDLDGDGNLDVHEDTDNDGICDVPNLWGQVLGDPTRMDSYRDLITFYELETDTLIFRPLVPLDERSTYAVVLTDRLRGDDGEPIVSPFDWVHGLSQTDSLRPVFTEGWFEDFGITNDNIRFAWTFTTQSVTREVLGIRNGLRGFGPFKELAEAYPPDAIGPAVINENPATPYSITVEELDPFFNFLFDEILGEAEVGFSGGEIGPVFDALQDIAYFTALDFEGPNFIDAGGRNFDIDFDRGEVAHQPAPIQAIIAIPKEEFGTGPRKVALYHHGYTSSKLEIMLVCGFLARHGIATVVMDAYAHGAPGGPELIRALLTPIVNLGFAPFVEVLIFGRSTDVNGDSFEDSGAGYYSNDPFRNRDTTRQTVIDYVNLLRIIQGFDGERLWDADVNGDGIANDIAGDFDGDGVVDLGGPDVEYTALGASMGGINSFITGAVEPDIRAAAPISPGGGLMEIALRSDLGPAQRPVLLPIMGSLLIGSPLPTDDRFTMLSWQVSDALGAPAFHFFTQGTRQGDEVVGQIRAGDIILVENHRTEHTTEIVVPPSRRFRVHVESDPGDRVTIRVWRPDGIGDRLPGSYARVDATLAAEIDTVGRQFTYNGRVYERDEPLEAIADGMGRRRNTPEMRRLLSLAQMLIEKGDPVSYARLYRNRPEVMGEDWRPSNVLLAIANGDMTVPVSASVSLMRALGVVSQEVVDPTYGIPTNQLLIDTGVMESVARIRPYQDSCCYAHCDRVVFNIDDLSNGLDAHSSWDDLERFPPTLSEVVPNVGCGGEPVPAECASAVCESRPPLRAASQDEFGILAGRFYAYDAQGVHVGSLPDPNVDFDMGLFMLNQVSLFLGTEGTVLSDNTCLADNNCHTCVDSGCPAIPPPLVTPAAP